MEEFIDQEILEEFIKETEEALGDLGAKFVALERDPGDEATINAIFRAVHSIKGSSAFFNLNHIRNYSHKMEYLLDELRKGQRTVTSEIIDILLKGIDHLSGMIARLSGGDMSIDFRGDEASHLAVIERLLESKEAAPPTPEKLMATLGPLVAAVRDDQGALAIPAVARLLEELAKAQSLLGAAAESPPAEGGVSIEDALALAGAPPDAPKPEEKHDAPKPAADKGEKKGAASTRKTLRIEEEKLDGFMNIVGELIINAEVFNYLQKKLEMGEQIDKLITEFKNANLDFNELTFNLQRGLAEVRKVSINGIFQKFPRMVRDLAQQVGKQVEFSVIGEEILIDKSLSESIESPLNHMIRNAVDHGIDTPDERIAAGKDPVGKVTVTATEQTGELVIVITDDGRGMNPDKLRAKAVEKGILTPHAAELMSDREAFRLIFAPGFSTAAQVTDISGRGVGMDVVMTAVQEAKGRVDIESAPGKGSRFIISVPLSSTLITISGLLVAVGKEKYIIPMEWIRESLQPEPKQVSTVKQQGEVIEIRGALYPLVRLHELFNVTPRSRDPLQAVVMVIDKENVRACLMVDEIIEETQVVLKDLGVAFASVKGIMGGAILGDGKVGLVLDVEGMLAVAGKGLAPVITAG
ncbi:MAG: chemotaxis protein CheA [Nitrospinae bacterium]|nr:chemotaxis protein CheA [Nitrospinota bacterium]